MISVGRRDQGKNRSKGVAGEVHVGGPKTHPTAGDENVIRNRSTAFLRSYLSPGPISSQPLGSVQMTNDQQAQSFPLFMFFYFYRCQGKVHIDTFISSKHRCKSAAQYILALSLLPCSSFCESHSSIAHCCVSIISI